MKSHNAFTGLAVGWLVFAAGCGGSTGTDLSGPDSVQNTDVQDALADEDVGDIQFADEIGAADLDTALEATGMDLADEPLVDIQAPDYPPVVCDVVGPEVDVLGVKPVAEFQVHVGPSPVPDGGTVFVQDKLSFFDMSYDPANCSNLSSFEWSVVQPALSAAVFDPSPTFFSPQFRPMVVGDYRFRLRVENSLGNLSDFREKLVHASAPAGCHLELTWHTPKDGDPTDQCFGGMDCGADMDLHVVHPYASSPVFPYGYFNLKYDCFWFNPHPVWEEDRALNPDYQPHLNVDDTDGAGPELFDYPFAKPGACYKVGVHYWDDHGFGPSIPTLRMFVDGDLVYEKTAPAMQNLDMWQAGEACCTDEVTPFIEYADEGGVVIIPNYINPDFNFTP